MTINSGPDSLPRDERGRDDIRRGITGISGSSRLPRVSLTPSGPPTHFGRRLGSSPSCRRRRIENLVSVREDTFN